MQLSKPRRQFIIIAALLLLLLLLLAAPALLLPVGAQPPTPPPGTPSVTVTPTRTVPGRIMGGDCRRVPGRYRLVGFHIHEKGRRNPG